MCPPAVFVKGTSRFGSWNGFRPEVKKGGGAPTLLGPIERDNLLSHWTEGDAAYET